MPVAALALIALAVPCARAGDDGGNAMPSYPWLKIGGFTDINFYATDEKGPSSTSGFKEGQFVLHFTSALAPRVSFFGEVTLNANNDQFKAELERTIIKFDQSDAFKISFGRYHTPINWWNVAFHHGQWLQTTVSRPEMTQFGGQFIPVHFVGGLVEGSFPAGGVNLNYKAGIGNGRSTIVSRGGDAGDVNNDRAWLVNLFVHPDAAYALQTGVAYYQDKITLDEDKGDFDEDIASAFVAWTKETPEVIAEYAHSKHEDLQTGEVYSGYAYYVQLAYRLPVWKQKLKPYARYERINVEEGDPIFDKQKDREGGLAGIRYDFSDYVAIKLEYRHQRTAKEDYVNAGYAQVSFAF